MVTFAVPTPPTSGGRKRALRLLEAMERAGATPHVLAMEGTPEGTEALRTRGWAVDVVPHGPPRAAMRARQLARLEPEPHNAALVARLRELAPETLLVQVEEIWQAQLATSVPAGVPSIASLHNVDSRLQRDLSAASPWQSREALRLRYRALRMAAVERRAIRAARATLAVSEEDATTFERRGAQSVLRVPNGVDEGLFELPIDGGEPGRVLFFGAFFWPPNRLGIERFLDEGWPAVVARRPDARLRIVGPGPVEALRARAAGVPGVDVAGLVPDIADELARASVVVVPVWLGGGTRIKVLEALAAARPVVGTSVGVERVGFRDGVHGFVRDAPEDLADGIVRLLGDPAAARRMGAAGREHGEAFRWTRTTAPAEELYRTMLAEAG